MISKKCSKLPVALDRCLAIYFKGSVHVKSVPCYDDGRNHRIYNYSVSDDTWNISPIKLHGSFKALAISNDQIVVIDTHKEEQGEEVIRIFPLSGDRDAVTTLQLGTVNKDASPHYLSAASDKYILVITYSTVKVLFKQSEQIEMPLPKLDRTPRGEYYFRSMLYGNHLYLSTASAGSAIDGRTLYYTQLQQLDQLTEHEKSMSPEDDDHSLSPPQHKKARLDQKSIPEWKHMPLLQHCCSNLAQFGKRLVTVRSRNGQRGIEINAYSPITESWVDVAEACEDIDHSFSENSTIVNLEETGELMVIECGNSYRDVYKLSIEGTYMQ